MTPAAHKLAVTSKSPFEALNEFLSLNPSIKFIRISWVDYAATVRTRVVRASYVLSQLRKPNNNGAVLAIVTMAMFLLPNDHPGIPDFVATSELQLCPDFSQIYVHPRKNPQDLPMYGSVMAKFQEQDGSPHVLCPRTVMHNALSKAEEAGITQFKMGFEIEFCLFEAKALEENRFESISKVHCWTSSRALQASRGKGLQILEDIMEALAENDIDAYQFHSEGAPGQCQ